MPKRIYSVDWGEYGYTFDIAREYSIPENQIITAIRYGCLNSVLLPPPSGFGDPTYEGVSRRDFVDWLIKHHNRCMTCSPKEE